MDHLQHTLDEGESCGHTLNRSLLCYKNDKINLFLKQDVKYNPDFEDKNNHNISKDIQPMTLPPITQNLSVTLVKWAARSFCISAVIARAL